MPTAVPVDRRLETKFAAGRVPDPCLPVWTENSRAGSVQREQREQPSAIHPPPVLAKSGLILPNQAAILAGVSQERIDCLHLHCFSTYCITLVVLYTYRIDSFGASVKEERFSDKDIGATASTPLPPSLRIRLEHI